MDGDGPSKAARYLRFIALAFAIVVVLCAVGVVPTRHLSGASAVPAMLVGCAIGLISAALAGALLTMAAGDTPEARMQRSVLAMMVRLAVVVGLGIAAALSGQFERAPLLFWMATTYVALLPLEVRLAISAG
jgi:hypothetical protein